MFKRYLTGKVEKRYPTQDHVKSVVDLNTIPWNFKPIPTILKMAIGNFKSVVLESTNQSSEIENENKIA